MEFSHKLRWFDGDTLPHIIEMDRHIAFDTVSAAVDSMATAF